MDFALEAERALEEVEAFDRVLGDIQNAVRARIEVVQRAQLHLGAPDVALDARVADHLDVGAVVEAAGILHVAEVHRRCPQAGVEVRPDDIEAALQRRLLEGLGEATEAIVGGVGGVDREFRSVAIPVPIAVGILGACRRHAEPYRSCDRRNRHYGAPCAQPALHIPCSLRSRSPRARVVAMRCAAHNTTTAQSAPPHIRALSTLR